MHADGDDDGIRRNRADGACLCQRFPFANVVKGMNTASKRIPQYHTPALLFADATARHETKRKIRMRIRFCTRPEHLMGGMKKYERKCRRK
jgi:hypothetical protein